MSRVVQVGSKDAKKSHEFQLESLQKIEYFRSRFSGRWDNNSGNDNNDNNGNDNDNKEKENLETSIEHEQFTIEDLIVLIKQIVEQSRIDPWGVGYQQLPSIVMCADFLTYKIDSKILMTFMQKCIPPLPQNILKQWNEIYTTPPYQVLIEAINQYFQNERTLPESEQAEILRDGIDQKQWNFETWFISDMVFLEAFIKEMKNLAAPTRGVFIWKLICKRDLVHLWRNEVVMKTIMDFFSSYDRWERRSQPKNFSTRISMLSSIILWGLKKNSRYLNMPKEYQNLDLYVEQYLRVVKDPGYLEREQKAKYLIELAINYRRRWEYLTTKYIPGALIEESMQILIQDPIWLGNIFEKLNSDDLKAIRRSILKISNNPSTDQKLLEAIKKYFVF